MIAALERAGFEPGDEVRIGDEEFELDPGIASGAPRIAAMTVVAKLGSSIVADAAGDVRGDVLDGCARRWRSSTPGGEDVVMVTSGAIALGMKLMGFDARPRAVDELQAASAVGQGSLFRAYESAPGASATCTRRRCCSTRPTSRRG